MRKFIGLASLLFFLSGCYQTSLAPMIGPAAGASQGRIAYSAISTGINYGVKHKTGKSPLEHVLSESQIKTVDKTKSKINPCKQNNKLCSVLSTRIEKTRKQLIGLNLQARIEKQHKNLFSKPTNN